MKWIDINDKKPNHGQDVAFVAVSTFRPDSPVNGRLLGGRYDSQLDCFCVPGHCYEGSHWAELTPPHTEKECD